MPSSDSETSSVPTTSNTTKSSSINTSVDTRIDQLKFSMDLIKTISLNLFMDLVLVVLEFFIYKKILELILIIFFLKFG